MTVPPRADRRESDRAIVVGGAPDCSHPPASLEFLDLMGTNALYRCRACGGVLVVEPP